jgi:hypothetical protein
VRGGRFGEQVFFLVGVIVNMKRNECRLSYVLLSALVGGLILLPSGCGFFENSGTISGMVRYKGEPLSEGSVSFVSEKGRAATGPIDKSGHYVVSGVQTGSAKVTVQVVSAEEPPMSFAGTPKSVQGKAAGTKIPLRYGVAATSGLQHGVTKGKQQFDIDLQE